MDGGEELRSWRVVFIPAKEASGGHDEIMTTDSEVVRGIGRRGLRGSGTDRKRIILAESEVAEGGEPADTLTIQNARQA